MTVDRVIAERILWDVNTHWHIYNMYARAVGDEAVLVIDRVEANEDHAGKELFTSVDPSQAGIVATFETFMHATNGDPS